MSVAIITGASSGLGREYALAVARQFPQIDEIWLIARRRERLEALVKELNGKKTVILPLDLADPQSFDEYAEGLKQASPDVRILINNAGFGWLGDFCDADWHSQTGMVDLNVRALTALSNLTLPYMKRGAFVVQVCSIAAFVPTPRMSVYCATKAYVLSFSKALREELRVKGINSLAVCPAPMETEFLDVAGVTGKSARFDSLPRVKPAQVAARSLAAAQRGRAVYTNRLMYKCYRVLGRLLPHGFVMRFTKV